MQKVNHLLNIKPLELKKIDIDLDSTEAFIKKQKRVADHKATIRANMAERKKKAQEQIQLKVEENLKKEAEKMDQEYALNLSEEENKKLELQQKAKQLQQERDDMAFKIITDFPSMEYQAAYSLLEQQNWNYQAVYNDILAQKRLQE